MAKNSSSMCSCQDEMSSQINFVKADTVNECPVQGVLNKIYIYAYDRQERSQSTRQAVTVARTRVLFLLDYLRAERLRGCACILHILSVLKSQIIWISEGLHGLRTEAVPLFSEEDSFIF